MFEEQKSCIMNVNHDERCPNDTEFRAILRKCQRLVIQKLNSKHVLDIENYIGKSFSSQFWLNQMAQKRKQTQ
jgi:hypothetical protein